MKNDLLMVKPYRRLKETITNGNLWLYVLSVLKKEKKAYGYVLDDKIFSYFGFKPNKIMLYIVIYKLEREGLLNSHYEERRKYYAITEKGKQALEKGIALLKETSKMLTKF